MSRFGEYTDEHGTPLFYMHLYDRTQADVNWYNPTVRDELFKVVNFWYEKGVRAVSWYWVYCLYCRW